MDNPNAGKKPANQPSSDADWYGFNQEKSVKTTPDKSQTTPGPGDDPYGYHQGGPAKPGGDTNKPGNQCPDGKGNLTLYDVAERELRRTNTEIKSQDDIYRKLNEMMVAHGHTKANLDGRTHINDHMLPKSWNNVDPRSLLDGDAKNCPPKHDKHPKPEPGHDKPHPPKHHPPEQQPPHQQPPHRDVPHPPPHPRSGYEQPGGYYEQQQPRQTYYQPQPRHRDDGGAQFANVIGSVIGGIGIGMLTGAINQHRYGGYDRGYNPGGYYGGYDRYDRGYDRYNSGYYDRGYYDRGGYYNNNGGYYNQGGWNQGWRPYRRF